MGDVVLVLNAGSSSIKFSLFAVDGDPLTLRLNGQIEGIGAKPHLVVFDRQRHPLADQQLDPAPPGEGHRRALAVLQNWLADHLGDGRLAAVGHRVVHGGPRLSAPVAVDEVILAELATFVPLAPLHQPHNLAGIQALKDLDPALPQVACFDTAFHRSNPQLAELFALPLDYYQRGIRRYGFHGLSYEYISSRLGEVIPAAARGKVVVAHLGNGASLAALADGQGVASTMGFTALDGLPMGTRCGQIDPGVLLYLLQNQGMDAKALEDLLYRHSGLKGLSGVSNDMRELEASHDPNAALAIDYFVYRIQRELGSLVAALQGLDALVFTAGIGEHSATLRARVCQGLGWLGVQLDPAANARHGPIITDDSSRVMVAVIPTNEELMIARQTLAVLKTH
ncbi:MAG: acetate/propionate family kinase [Candidatus Competibacterales bacterium]